MYKQKKLRRIDRCFCFGEMNFLSGCIECMKFMLIVICINAWILTLHIFSLTSYKSRNDLGENWYFRKWILYYSLNKISVLRQSLDFLMYNFFFYLRICLFSCWKEMHEPIFIKNVFWSNCSNFNTFEQVTHLSNIQRISKLRYTDNIVFSIKFLYCYWIAMTEFCGH